MIHHFRLFASLVCLLLAHNAAGADQDAQPKVRVLKTAAGRDSSSYSLSATRDGQVFLTWIEKKPEEKVLRFSRLEEDKWSRPRTIASGAALVVNWIDRPAIGTSGGVLLAYWLERPVLPSGPAPGYGLRAVRSVEGGRTWSPAFDIGMDNTVDYTGFGTLQPMDDGLLMAYLHPLRAPSLQGLPDDRYVKTLRLTDIEPNGGVRSDVLLDADVCSCCPLDIATPEEGPVVVYRDHEPGEIRDISIVRRIAGKWTEPQPVHRDGWTINGCPTNGPAIAADGQIVATAWFTGAGEQPQVLLAFSSNNGAQFGNPMRIDDGLPQGWADIVLDSMGGAVVSWLAQDPRQKGRSRLLLRTVARDGGMGPVIDVAATSPSRTAGVPRMVRRGLDLILAWQSETGVRTALVSTNGP